MAPSTTLEGVRRAASQESVELRKLAPLALPPHPDTLPWVPAARPVEQKEGIVGPVRMARVQLADAAYRRLEDGGIVLPSLGR